MLLIGLIHVFVNLDSESLMLTVCPELSVCTVL